jgi:hypothetical protein
MRAAQRCTLPLTWGTRGEGGLLRGAQALRFAPARMCRTYVCFDVLRRIMREHFGYNVTMIMNITDIDDKIIKQANEDGVPFTEVAIK